VTSARWTRLHISHGVSGWFSSVNRGSAGASLPSGAPGVTRVRRPEICLGSSLATDRLNGTNLTRPPLAIGWPRVTWPRALAAPTVHRGFANHSESSSLTDTAVLAVAKPLNSMLLRGLSLRPDPSPSWTSSHLLEGASSVTGLGGPLT
jgi:hypothetical protein